MRVLVTGGCGNIGSGAVRELLARGHRVRCLDVPSKANRRLVAGLRGVEARWGDIRDESTVRTALAGCDVVAHLVAVIPPRSEDDPDLARGITVGGTERVVAAARAMQPRPRLVYVSSIALFGPTQHLEPPRRAGDPIHISDLYTSHKAECERLVRGSGLPWVVLRMGACPPLDTVRSMSLGGANPMMFDVPLTDRIEFIHPADAGLAVANAALCAEADGRTLLIGGGARCQIRQADMLFPVLEAIGVGRLPESAFTTAPFHTDWLDTEESQRLLAYQRHTVDDYARDLVQRLGWRRLAIRALRPLIRREMLKRSAHYLAAVRG
jgi:UDP-glucose 4-epimerase